MDTYVSDNPAGWIGDFYFKGGKLTRVRLRDGEADYKVAQGVAKTFGVSVGDVYRRLAEVKAKNAGHTLEG